MWYYNFVSFSCISSCPEVFCKENVLKNFTKFKWKHFWWSLIFNTVLKKLWNEFLETKLDPDIRGRIIELNHQMEIFGYFNGVKLGSLLLKHSDNVSRTIQHSYMSVADCQLVVALATKTAQTRFFYSFRKNVRKLQQKWI